MAKALSLFLLVFILAYSSQIVGQKAGAQGPSSVIVAPVIRGDFSDQVEALGTTKANESVVITADRSEK